MLGFIYPYDDDDDDEKFKLPKKGGIYINLNKHVKLLLYQHSNEQQPFHRNGV